MFDEGEEQPEPARVEGQRQSGGLSLLKRQTWRIGANAGYVLLLLVLEPTENVVLIPQAFKEYYVIY